MDDPSPPGDVRADWIARSGAVPILESLISELLRSRPAEPLGHLAQWLAQRKGVPCVATPNAIELPPKSLPCLQPQPHETLLSLGPRKCAGWYLELCTLELRIWGPREPWVAGHEHVSGLLECNLNVCPPPPPAARAAPLSSNRRGCFHNFWN